MTLSEIKEAILNNTKTEDICDTLHDAMIAADEDELIESGLPLVVWSYQTGVVDDSLLAEFDEAKLNAAGIYSSGTFTLTNPEKELFILKSANVTINLTGTSRIKINVLGAATVTINASANTYTTLKMYDNSDATVTLDDAAMMHAELKGDATADITQNDESILHIYGRGKSATDLEQNNNSYCLAKLYIESTLNYFNLDASVFNGTAYNNAVITNALP